MVYLIEQRARERTLTMSRAFEHYALHAYAEHYLVERNRQGIGRWTIVSFSVPDRPRETVDSRRRLGGLLNYYYRAAT